MIETRGLPEMHLHGDIPVVEVEGEWDETVRRGLADLVLRLAHSGHLEIIVNLSRMTFSRQADSDWVILIEEIASAVRTRRGRLDVVVTLEQSAQICGNQTRAGLFWAASEEEAIGHIKGLPIARGGAILTMRFAR